MLQSFKARPKIIGVTYTEYTLAGMASEGRRVEVGGSGIPGTRVHLNLAVSKDKKNALMQISTTSPSLGDQSNCTNYTPNANMVPSGSPYLHSLL